MWSRAPASLLLQLTTTFLWLVQTQTLVQKPPPSPNKKGENAFYSPNLLKETLYPLFCKITNHPLFPLLLKTSPQRIRVMDRCLRASTIINCLLDGAYLDVVMQSSRWDYQPKIDCIMWSNLLMERKAGSYTQKTIIWVQVAYREKCYNAVLLIVFLPSCNWQVFLTKWISYINQLPMSSMLCIQRESIF